MRPFDYVAPSTEEELLRLVGQHGDDARLLAGGQSLLILLRQRLLAPEVVVDLKRIDSLGGLDVDPTGLRVGATATYDTVARSPIAQAWPLLTRASGSVGSMHIRNRGTIGGSIAHADPAGDVPVALMALDAQIVTRSPRGDVRFSASGFFTGMFSTAKDPDAVVIQADLPPQPEGSTYGYRRFMLRDGEFPLTQVAVRLQWEGESCTGARIAIGGGADRPTRLIELEEWLVGTRRGEVSGSEIRERVRGAIRPADDVRGSADWKGKVVAVTASIAYQEAVEGSPVTHA